jgi:hypothetical protein
MRKFSWKTRKGRKNLGDLGEDREIPNRMIQI